MVHSQGIWLGDSVELDKTKTELRTARWVHPVYTSRCNHITEWMNLICWFVESKQMKVQTSDFRRRKCLEEIIFRLISSGGEGLNFKSQTTCIKTFIEFHLPVKCENVNPSSFVSHQIFRLSRGFQEGYSKWVFVWTSPFLKEGKTKRLRFMLSIQVPACSFNFDSVLIIMLNVIFWVVM